MDLQLIDFKLPPPRELADVDRDLLIRGSLSRIWNDPQLTDGSDGHPQTAEMWMMLVVRMVTRVVNPSDKKNGGDAVKSNDDVLQEVVYARQDRLRQVLCDYVMADFPSR